MPEHDDRPDIDTAVLKIQMLGNARRSSFHDKGQGGSSDCLEAFRGCPRWDRHACMHATAGSVAMVFAFQEFEGRPPLADL